MIKFSTIMVNWLIFVFFEKKKKSHKNKTQHKIIFDENSFDLYLFEQKLSYRIHYFFVHGTNYDSFFGNKILLKFL